MRSLIDLCVLYAERRVTSVSIHLFVPVGDPDLETWCVLSIALRVGEKIPSLCVASWTSLILTPERFVFKIETIGTVFH